MFSTHLDFEPLLLTTTHESNLTKGLRIMDLWSSRAQNLLCSFFGTHLSASPHTRGGSVIFLTARYNSLYLLPHSQNISDTLHLTKTPPYFQILSSSGHRFGQITEGSSHRCAVSYCMLVYVVDLSVSSHFVRVQQRLASLVCQHIDPTPYNPPPPLIPREHTGHTSTNSAGQRLYFMHSEVLVSCAFTICPYSV